MCLIIKKGPIKAKNKVICWKVFEKEGNNLISPYRYTIWPKKGLSIDNLKAESNMVEKGLHAYTTREMARAERFDWGKGYATKKMYIPRGATYYIGIQSDIVATKMRFFK